MNRAIKNRHQPVATLQMNILVGSEADPRNKHRVILPYVYFHGRAEREFGTISDYVICLEGQWPLPETRMIDVWFKGKLIHERATLFMWRSRVGIPRGLVVIDDDIIAWTEAYTMYKDHTND